ncbi:MULTISPECIES: hypothetical protein [Bartonella]|nr:hypothetical protein [Bartonella taylorii]
MKTRRLVRRHTFPIRVLHGVTHPTKSLYALIRIKNSQYFKDFGKIVS